MTATENSALQPASVHDQPGEGHALEQATHYVAQLGQALLATDAVVAAVSDDEWSTATGCPEWTAHDLLNHLVGGNLTVAALLVGHAPPHPADDHLDGNPLTAYRASGDALRAAFGEPGALERTVTLPMGVVSGAVALHLRLTELLVHGWDLARATGQPVTGLPADLAEQELAFSRAQLDRIPPERRPFAVSQPVADNAPAVDRLAALLGRPVPVSES